MDDTTKDQLQKAQDIINALAVIRNELSDRLVQAFVANAQQSREISEKDAEIADLKKKLEL